MIRIICFCIVGIIGATAPALAAVWTIQDYQPTATDSDPASKGYVGGGYSLDPTDPYYGQTGDITTKYYQKDGDVISQSGKRRIDKFDIDLMEIEIDDFGKVTVKIVTDYVDGALTTSYGDLFISTDGWHPSGSGDSQYRSDTYLTGENWEYVLDTSTSGIFSMDDNYTVISDDIHGPDATKAGLSDDIAAQVAPARNQDFRHHQEVLFDSTKAVTDGSSVKTGEFDFIHDRRAGFLTYSFNLDAFGLTWQDELDLGFHWTMTCANDVIEGSVFKAGEVPEPGTMMLLGLGLLGLGAWARKPDSLG